MGPRASEAPVGRLSWYIEAKTKWPPFFGTTFIFFNDSCCILIRISLKIVPKGPLNNESTLVQIMAYSRIGIGQPRWVCRTIDYKDPQWVNSSPHGQNGCNVVNDNWSVSVILHWSLFLGWLLITARHQTGQKPFFEPMIYSAQVGMGW